MLPELPAATPRPDIEFIIDILRRLIAIPSPAGHTEAAVRLLEHELDRIGVRHARTHRGALIASCPGREAGPHRTFAGHIDTLAAMVKEIDRGGCVRFTQIGGYAPGTVEGEYCTIETCGGQALRGTVLYERPSTHVSKEIASAKRETENLMVRVDVTAVTPEDLRAAGVRVGDYIHFDPRFELTDSGFIKSRHLDDKAGVACILGALAAQTAAHLRPRRTTHFYFSTSEEVGFGASSGIPEETGQLIAVDMGAVGRGQESDEYSVAICAKDSTGPFDYQLRQRLTEVCRQHSIRHRIDVYPHYGSDAAAALRAGADVVTGLIGPGINASHSLERTHRRALTATAQLILAFSELA